MYAVIETGGKQYRVEKGDRIDVEKLNAEPDSTFYFDKVLFVSGDGANPILGKPYIEGAKVVAKIVEHLKGEKVVVYKFHKRKKYRRKRGHRQLLTRIEIIDIISGKG